MLPEPLLSERHSKIGQKPRYPFSFFFTHEENPGDKNVQAHAGGRFRGQISEWNHNHGQINTVKFFWVSSFWVWVGILRPVGIWGYLQGENIHSYNLFSPVMMITLWMKPAWNSFEKKPNNLFLRNFPLTILCSILLIFICRQSCVWLKKVRPE